jgi:signal transduction histidine kinase
MSLASRLSASFLAALAIVLIGFSSALYALAWQYLHRLVEERLDSALTTLAAAAEVGAQGVEWEPDERVLGLGQGHRADQVRWLVRDPSGGLLDRSPNWNPRRLPLDRATATTPAADRYVGPDGRPWRIKSRWLRAPSSSIERTSEPGGPSPFHDALNLVVFAPLGPTEATLRRLALTVVGLSAALWVAAAVAGRRLCRRALAPLSKMAAAARDADADDPGGRLPVPSTGDELEDLAHAFNGLLARQHETLERLHEALERQRRFTGDASHQFRTPLAGLLSQVDVALRRPRPPEEYQRVLGVVRTKAIHLQQIVESLLFLARSETEAGRPELEVVDLAAWVNEHLQAWPNSARLADLRRVEDHPGPLWVLVHPPLLAQAFDNLLENASKYSPSGSPIIVRTARTDDGVQLSVEDRGEGLNPEELDRVFEPFYRSPQARRQSQAGVGLGLTVARRIVTALGGTITATALAEPGRGSCFLISLPDAPDPVEAAPVASSASSD